MTGTKTLLAISGSLRARSTNTEVLRAAALLAPRSVLVTLYEALGALPHFNPDLDEEGATPPAPVRDLRAHVAAADGLVICSPEYAHGVPGVLKNALDWLVSGPEIVHKPVLLFNATPRSTHAQESLAETLRTMSTMLVADGAIALPFDGRRLDAAEIVADPELTALIRDGMTAVARAVAFRTPSAHA